MKNVSLVFEESKPSGPYRPHQGRFSSATVIYILQEVQKELLIIDESSVMPEDQVAEVVTAVYSRRVNPLCFFLFFISFLT